MPSWFTGIFFDSWSGLLRVVVVGVLAYAALVVGLRLSGKRTLSKMNAFDLVVTVALGSTLATIILSQDVALVEGVVAFVVLIALQHLISWLSVRSLRFSMVIKSEPTLVFFRGSYLPGQMRAVRIVEAEILAAVRAQGIADLDEVEAVVLESDGSFTTVRRADGAATALANVSGLGGVAGRADC